MADPSPTSTHAPGGWLGFWVGIVVTVGLVAALVQLWPEDDLRTLGSNAPATPTTRFGVPELPEGFPDDVTDQLPPTDPNIGPAADLFTIGLPEAVGEVLARTGAERLFEVAVYPGYVYVTLETATVGPHRWYWSADRVMAEDHGLIGTVEEAGAFSPAELDLARIPSLVDDAPSHYGVPVTVTHVLVNRFLPFDQRVLVRVYASPPGDPAGGGYVSYTTDGTLVAVCC